MSVHSEKNAKVISGLCAETMEKMEIQMNLWIHELS